MNSRRRLPQVLQHGRPGVVPEKNKTTKVCFVVEFNACNASSFMAQNGLFLFRLLRFLCRGLLFGCHSDHPPFPCVESYVPSPRQCSGVFIGNPAGGLPAPGVSPIRGFIQATSSSLSSSLSSSPSSWLPSGFHPLSVTAFSRKRRYRDTSCWASLSSDICEYFSLTLPPTRPTNSSASLIAWFAS